jgi:hypothetical protein
MTTRITNLLGSLKRPPSNEMTTPLSPLYPTSETNDHKIYVDALNEAFGNLEIKNIALTGSYGSGKSSILKDFIKGKEDKTILISFSTLGANIKDYTSDGTPEENKKSLDSTANLIQKEVIKQILYKEKYDKIPESRYPRISKINFWRTIGLTITITALFPIVLFAFNQIDILKLNKIRVAAVMELVYLAALVLSLVALKVMRKLQVEKLSGGPISITLSGANNYFDKYIDEIIYFFEATNYEVVVFEDIDRFKNLYIFENLRQLNTLINSSKQVNRSKRGGKQVRFVYAVKDSIFSEAKDDDENRTKFFDLIVPIVPFITYKNSRDVITDLFRNYDIDEDVINIVSKYITDMRLAKNIYNEFRIFNEKIVEDGKIEELSRSNLFAIIVFKNKYLKDFEDLKDKDSKLDKIYDQTRNFIDSEYESIGTEIADLKSDINGFDNIDVRCKGYGLKLIALSQKKMEEVNGYYNSYVVNGTTYDKSAAMLTKDFWVKLAGATAEPAITFSYMVKGQYYSAGNSLAISTAEIETEIGRKLNVGLWLEDDVQLLKKRLATKEAALALIRTRNTKDLMQYYPTFNAQVEEITGGGLLKELVALGYIDANYTLYTSIYREDNVSARGKNFIIHNLQQNKQDLTYKFEDEEDIRKTLNDLVPTDFENRSIYNFDILNYLLKFKDPKLAPVLNMLTAATPEDLDFLNKFVENDGEVDFLIAALAKNWRGLFNYLVENASLAQDDKNHLLDVALLNGDVSVQYITSHQISEHANQLENLKNNESKRYTETASELLAHFDVELLSLDGIKNKKLLEFVESNNLYEINTANIESLIGGKNLSLTNIKNLKSQVFEYVSKHLDQYVSILDESSETEHSVETSESLVEVLKAGSDQQTDVLDIIIEAALEDCYIDDINDVDPKTWPSLFKHVRATNMLPNVIDYYDSKEKQIDAILVGYINTAKNLTENEIIDDQVEKKAFALSVLDSDIDQVVKVSVVEGLGLDGYITPGEFKGYAGDMYGLLVSKGVIEDTAVTYNSLTDLSWATKESYISHSPKFDEYIADVKFSSDDMNAMSESGTVKPTVKKYILDNIATYKELTSVSSASHFAEYALSNNYALNATNLAVALNGLREQNSVKLLLLSLDQLTKENLMTILPIIGSNYAKLAQPSKHPSLEYNNDNLALVKRLHELRIVSSYEEKKGKLRANTKANL